MQNRLYPFIKHHFISEYNQGEREREREREREMKSTVGGHGNVFYN